MSQSFLGIDDLSFASLFPSSQPSYISVRATNPNDTDISTRDTIQLMNRHSIADSKHHLVREAAQEIAEACSDPSDESQLIQGTFDYLKEHVSFVEDETILGQLFGIDSGVELLITPARLLSMNKPMGDCDDFSSLVKAILLNFGIENDFVTVAADKSNPQKWSHVYNMATLRDGTHKFIDSSHGKYLGWEAPNSNRKVVWKLKDQSKGLNGVKTNMFVDKYDALNVERNCGMNNFGLGELGELGELGDAYCAPDLLAAGECYLDNPVAPNTGGGTNWASLLSPFIKASSSIAVAQFGQPQLAPGTFIRGPQGQILTNQPITGGGAFSSIGSGVSNIGSSGLLIGAVVIGGLILLGGGGRR